MFIKNNERALVVQVRYGLSNRLWTIAKAYAWSYLFRRRLSIIWEPEEACGCTQSDLFDDGLRLLRIFVPDQEHFTCYDGIYREYAQQTALSLAIHSHRVDPRHLLNRRNLFIKAFDLSLAADRNIGWPSLIASSPLYHRIFRWLQRRYLLQLEIRDEIHGLFPDYETHNLTGLHIRIGDSKAPLIDFPDFSDKFRGQGYERFFALLEQFFERQPDEQIYLACNSAEFQEKIAGHFPGKILFYPKRSLDRASAIAIEDALIDLIMLSRTKRIIGTKHSSFSKLASLWGNVPVQLV
jgi:hypothetical protein